MAIEIVQFANSDALLGAAYDGPGGELTVILRAKPAVLASFGPLRFGDRRYLAFRYEGVPSADFAHLREAPSAGRAYNELLRSEAWSSTVMAEDLSPIDYPSDRAHLVASGDLAGLVAVLDALAQGAAY